jgi:hypothetical protein
MNLLQNGNFDVWYIEIFGQRYKVVKSNTKIYFTNNFERYGNIFSLDKEEKIWTTKFLISNLAILDGNIRFDSWNVTFIISPIGNTKAYYKIQQQ